MSPAFWFRGGVGTSLLNTSRREASRRGAQTQHKKCIQCENEQTSLDSVEEKCESRSDAFLPVRVAEGRSGRTPRVRGGDEDVVGGRGVASAHHGHQQSEQVQHAGAAHQHRHSSYNPGERLHKAHPSQVPLSRPWD